MTTRCLSVILLFAASVCAAPATAVHDPIEGKWYGKAGFPTDRVNLGFEFKRDDKGALQPFVYGPIFNFYGLHVPGGLTRGGDGSYISKDWGIKFTLKNDEIDGVMLGNTPLQEWVESCH